MRRSATESISITAAYQVLHRDVNSALMSLHCMTGCDTVGKFAGKSKEKWTKEYLKVSFDSEIIKALIRLQCEENNEIFDILEQFVCGVYHPNSKGDRSLRDTRYVLFNKKVAECEKLPPTKGAFIQHMKRAHRQLTM